MKSLRHELVRLAGLALAATLALRALFFAVAPWLWGLARPFVPAEITPWARPPMGSRDGAEPYALLSLVGLLWVALALGMAWLGRGASRRRWIGGVLLLGAGAWLAVVAPPLPPMPEVTPDWMNAVLVAVAAVAASLLIARAVQGGGRLPTAVAVILAPLCLVPTTLPSLQDAGCILAPALRLAHDAHLRDVYFQYDLLPSLLALGWMRVGGASLTYGLVGAATFYALFLGLFWLGRRMFLRPTLAAPLLVALVIVRFYAVAMDSAATPQVTPMRLDLWAPLLAVAFVAGLRHWLVGLTLGAMCFFSRSVGTLYVGAYALALMADLVAVRRAPQAGARPPLARALAALARETAPAWGFVALAFLLARIIFGSFGSDAIAVYRQYGVGMLRITRESFYWWLLPFTGAVGWLAVAARGTRPARHGQAAIFAVALLAASSIYFFGRSHEHNLINLSAAFLFCAFLGIDLASELLVTERGTSSPIPEDPSVLRAALRIAPWAIVAVCAYAYSARVVDKLGAQAAVVAGQRVLPPGLPGDFQPVPACDELGQAAGDRRVYFFSRNDYWLYERCGIAPQGYVQPLWLTILKAPLVAELDRLLSEGYKIAVPRQAGDWSGQIGEFLPALGNPTRAETPHYLIYRRAGAP